jgi:hypothetical protein
MKQKFYVEYTGNNTRNFIDAADLAATLNDEYAGEFTVEEIELSSEDILEVAT